MAGPLTNLPTPLTTLIGRDRDLESLRHELLQPASRLFTLTGAGGCGKTRLALDLARDLLAAFPDGVWLVELAPLSDPALVPHAVAAPFGVRESPGRPLLGALSSFFELRRLLLVLDNCEHLVEPAAALVQQLLAACPALHILATSREPLRIPGEVTWRVPSLAFPDPLHLPPLDELALVPAVRLFAERAHAAEPSFAVTARNAPVVAQVCARLDGIPLALELAAARVRVLPVEQLATRMDDSFRLLVGGSRTAPTRQQTLQATLDWSHALLDAPERRLFRRLAVFVGDWTLEAAEAVCAGAGIARADVLDLLSRLVDKSLVLREPREGEARYRLLEPIRQYAQERLAESGEVEAAARRHVAHYRALAEQIAAEVWGARVYTPFGTSEQIARFTRLEQEHANLRAALRWAHARRESRSLPRLSLALWPFWFLHGYVAEARHWLEETIARSESQPIASRARALAGLGLVVWAQADYARAAALDEEAITLFRAIGDTWNAAITLNILGVSVGFQGDFVAARRHLEESIQLFRELGDAWGVGIGFFDLGKVARYQGDAVEARGLIEEGLALLRAANDLAQSAEALTDLAGLAAERGDHEQVVAHVRDALELLRQMRSPYFLPDCLELLAGVAGARRDAARAARLLGAAEALRETTGAAHDPIRGAAYTRLLGSVQSAMKDATFAAARAAGRALSVAHALEEALQVPVPPPPDRPSGPLALLTPREREVAALLAQGLTNRQIAEALVIADGTVNIHVHNVLSKLELTSRAQVAAWAVEHGLHPRGAR